MGYRVAVLGATGAVGGEMLKILAERNFPVSELVPLASERSAGRQIDFAGEKLTIRKAEEGAFRGMDIVLGAAENDIAMEMAPYIKKAGAVFVDNSSAFRLDPDVPLVVPEVNAAEAMRHKGIIANPNCVTIIAAVAMNPILQISPAKRVIASSYQAVSGAGIAGLMELEAQAKAYGDPDLCHQVVYNLIENAVKFTEDGGYIEFSVEDLPEETRATIRNSGIGIEPEEIGMIFERFYKTDKSRSKDKNGMGLGLYIVKTIIRLHGGDIRARSEKGQYTEFSFSLPKKKDRELIKEQTSLKIQDADYKE